MDYPIKTLNQLRPILQGFRKAAGLTQAAMAAHLGVTQQTYAQLEANPATVSVERLFKVLQILQVDMKLAQGDAATGGVIEETAPPAAERPPARRPARKVPAAAASSGTARANPTARNPQSSPGKTAHTTHAVKQLAGTATPEVRGKNGKNAPRPARTTTKTAAPKVTGKKREDW
ncbi:helix-turn-helix transcriptional regulator [Paraburkholderia sp. ZP32-5]|uniref:helix-turn-helix transcriptional regulator n=1 Tax=Paraburkholderia sp. ZP32-5 TaxID=2883245 RepID=UPI001F311E7F|nr:helix-turn-helix transcriptional regulator [Paraburkholderia sp. ZP32-5]